MRAACVDKLETESELYRVSCTGGTIVVRDAHEQRQRFKLRSAIVDFSDLGPYFAGFVYSHISCAALFEMRCMPTGLRQAPGAHLAAHYFGARKLPAHLDTKRIRRAMQLVAD